MYFQLYGAAMLSEKDEFDKSKVAGEVTAINT